MNTNPKKNGFALKDAASIAMILTATKFFSVFMLLYSVGAIKADPFSFCYALIQFLGSGFFTDFIMLTGLNTYYTRKEAKVK